MLHEFSYVAPLDQKALLEVLAGHRNDAKILAGGTDLLVNIRNGILKPKILIDIKKIKEFSGITYDSSQGLQIGVCTTINDMLKYPAVSAYYPLLQTCGHDLASYQVRNRATVIGNIVNASPCSDMAPALLCLDALVEILSNEGKRIIPINEFFTGVKKTVLGSHEIVNRIIIPDSSRNAQGLYHKLKRIKGHDLGIVGVAIAKLDTNIRIAVSSAAPTPVVTEKLPFTMPEKEILDVVKSIIRPISDVRCSKEYRLFMTEVYTKRLLREVQK
jgi:CO/xanthine dehydrogenase FAD-binding subunit